MSQLGIKMLMMGHSLHKLDKSSLTDRMVLTDNNRLRTIGQIKDVAFWRYGQRELIVLLFCHLLQQAINAELVLGVAEHCHPIVLVLHIIALDDDKLLLLGGCAPTATAAAAVVVGTMALAAHVVARAGAALDL